jgi:hypothetical protein
MAVNWAMPLVVERTFARLNQFRRLRVRYEKRTDIHEAFLCLACALLCWAFSRVESYYVKVLACFDRRVRNSRKILHLRVVKRPNPAPDTAFSP